MSFAPALNAATAGRGLPVAEYLALAQRHGYRWVEFDRAQILPLAEMGADAAGELLERTGTRIASFFLPVAWTAEEPVFSHDLGRLGVLLPVLAKLGATRCCTWLMPNHPTPAAETRLWAGGRLRRVADLLAEHGLRFGLEFVGPAHLRREPGHTFLYRMEEMLAFAEELGPTVGILVDSLHWHCVGGTVEALAAVPAERLVHAHIDDAPDLPRDAVLDDGRLLPGEGVIDLCGFLGGLAAAGFSGPIGIEVDGPALQHLSADAAAAAARQAWDRLLARCQKEGQRA
jgi:sugar phosphate isomerase/epimerase